jgi:hypothetical protein
MSVSVALFLIGFYMMFGPMVRKVFSKKAASYDYDDSWSYIVGMLVLILAAFLA